MKVAEALAQRADLDRRLRQIEERIKRSARFSEGEDPAEDAVVLLSEARELLAQRENLIRQINLTNAGTILNGGSVTGLIALRDRLHAEQNLLNEIATAAGGERDYYGSRRRSELPVRTTLPVSELRAQADRLAREYRELDNQISASNWVTDLL